MKRLFSLLLCNAIWFSVFSQKVESIAIGDTIPKSIWAVVPKTSTTKLVILDFWYTGCKGCLESFSKMERLQRQFASEVSIVLVNTMESEEKINERFTNLNKKRPEGKKLAVPLNLHRINGNKLFSDLFPHRSYPHLVWINGDGKILSISGGYSYDINAGQVENAIQNGMVNLPLKNDQLSEDIEAIVLDST